MPTELENMQAELSAKMRKVQDFLQSKKDKSGRFDLTDDELNDVRTQEKELNTLGAKLKEQRYLADIDAKNAAALAELDTPVHPSGHGSGKKAGQGDPYVQMLLENKGLGDFAALTPEFKAHVANVRADNPFKPFSLELKRHLDVKTVMTETGTGFSPPNYRTPIVVLSPQRKPVLQDLIPSDPTMLQTVKYMLETTYTDNAAATSEGGVAPSSLVGYTEESVLVQWIPTILPVTEQQLEDVPQLQGLLNNRLSLMVNQSEESEILSGSGSSPHLTGFLNVSGIQTQAMSSDPIFDAVFKALTLIRFTGFSEPDAVVFNPSDWQLARLAKTTIGSYILGNPDSTGADMLFGLPVVVTPVISQGTALAGAFRMYSGIWRRAGLRIEVGYVNDDFARGQKTLRASTRLALTVYRPQAFCTVTGIPSS